MEVCGGGGQHVAGCAGSTIRSLALVHYGLSRGYRAAAEQAVASLHSIRRLSRLLGQARVRNSTRHICMQGRGSLCTLPLACVEEPSRRASQPRYPHAAAAVCLLRKRAAWGDKADGLGARALATRSLPEWLLDKVPDSACCLANLKGPSENPDFLLQDEAPDEGVTATGTWQQLPRQALPRHPLHRLRSAGERKIARKFCQRQRPDPPRVDQCQAIAPFFWNLVPWSVCATSRAWPGGPTADRDWCRACGMRIDPRRAL